MSKPPLPLLMARKEKHLREGGQEAAEILALQKQPNQLRHSLPHDSALSPRSFGDRNERRTLSLGEDDLALDKPPAKGDLGPLKGTKLGLHLYNKHLSSALQEPEGGKRPSTPPSWSADAVIPKRDEKNKHLHKPSSLCKDIQQDTKDNHTTNTKKLQSGRNNVTKLNSSTDNSSGLKPLKSPLDLQRERIELDKSIHNLLL